jgi:hypothetical protein
MELIGKMGSLVSQSSKMVFHIDCPVLQNMPKIYGLGAWDFDLLRMLKNIWSAMSKNRTCAAWPCSFFTQKKNVTWFPPGSNKDWIEMN